MLSVNIDSFANMFRDNKSVVLNITVFFNVLKKKNCALSYYKIRKTCATFICKFTHIKSKDNYANILTKPLSTTVFYGLIKLLLFRQLIYVKSNVEKMEKTKKCK